VRHLRRWNPFRRAHFARLRELEAAVVRDATVLALSPRMVDDLARLHPRAKAVLCRPGVDLARFAPGAGGGGLLFVAHNFRLKGLDATLRALRRLPDARLTVVGPDRPRPAERVAYVRSPGDLPALYGAADVLVHPTFYDTASRVVLEALAAGAPAITTVRDGNADLAVDAGGVALEDPGDDAALARAVGEVLGRADRERARAVAERLPEEKMLDEVVEALACASSS
jgi:glycosyltransferase involved in cell wall biosynthesis